MNSNSHRIVAEDEWTIGGLAPELEAGFQRLPLEGRDVTMPVVLSERAKEVRQDAMGLIGKHVNLDDESSTALGISLQELLMNIALHGNGCKPYKWGRLVVCILETRDSAFLVLQAFDQGETFDLEAVPDPTAAENLESVTGRGLMLMRRLGGFEIEPPVPAEEGGKVMKLFRRLKPNGNDGLFQLEPLKSDSDEAEASVAGDAVAVPVAPVD